MVNRLAIELSVNNADSGIAKLRAAKGEMRGVRDAANDAERGVDHLGDEFDQTARKADRYGDAAQRAGRQTDGLSRVAVSAGARLASVGAAAAGAAAGLAAVGTIRIAGNFENEFTKVVTLLDDSSFAAGVLNDNIDGLKTGLRELRAQSGDSFENLSKGLFDLVSAGVAADDSIRVLNDANKLAKAGVTDVSVAVDGLTTALNAYGIEASKSEALAAKFFTTQKFGKTTVEELARGLGQVAPLAAQLGVSLDELLAAQAAATSTGIRQSEAYTGLKAVLTNIVKPAKDAADEAARLGVAFDASALKAKGFTQFLSEIQKANNFTDESFQKLFGSAEALNTVLAITGGGADVYAKTLRELGDEARSVATLNDAYEAAVKTADQATKEFAGSLDQLAVIAGDAGALEAYTQIVRELTELLRSNAAQEFAKNFGESLKLVSDAAIGLLAVLRDIKNITEFVGRDGTPVGNALGVVDFINRNTPINAAIGAAGRGLEGLAKRGREEQALKQTDPIAQNVPRDIGDIISAIGRADDAAKVAESVGGIDVKAIEIGNVEKALRDQLQLAQRLNDAAQGGKIRYEVEFAAVNLDNLAQAAVDKAKQAGEELSFATARLILSQIDGLEKSTQAMLDAEKALRERASERSDNIAKSLEERIAGFSTDVQRADLSSKTVVAAFEDRFRKLVNEIDETSIGLNTDQLEDLYRELEAAGIGWRKEVQSAFDYGADQVRNALESSFGNILDDLIFNGGKGFADEFNRLIRGAANDNIIDPIAKALTGRGNIFDNISGAFEKQLAGFQKAFGNVLGSVASAAFAGFQGFEVGKGLSGLLGITGNKSSQRAGGAIGGLAGLGITAGLGLGLGGAAAGGLIGGASIGAVAGSVVPVIGTLIGAALGTLLSGLLSKPSDNTAQGVFNPATGAIAGVNQDKGGSANAQVRDELIKQITNVTKSVTDLIGAQITNPANTPANESFLNLAVRSDRKTGKSFFEVGFQGANGEPSGGKRFDATEQGAIDAVSEALRLTISALRGGEAALLDYAKAASQAGRSADEIVNGLQSLQAVLKIADEPISDVAAQLKVLDDTINPVIEDLKALGVSLSGVQSVAQRAGRAIGENFIEGIQEELDRAITPALASFKALLKDQAQDLKDAQALLQRGFISPDEFRLVQQKNAVEQTAFFKNLDQDALNQLGDYLGLIRENGGEASVILLQFNQELETTIDSLTDGLQALREEANRFLAAATASQNLAQDIRRRLSGEVGTVQLATLRGDLQGLLAQVQSGAAPGADQATRSAALNAAERAPDVAQQFINLAEKRFGASAGLASARDFITDILDRIGAASQGIGNDLLSQVEAANEQVSLLGDIRTILSTPDPALSTLQNILDNGQIQSATLNSLLEQFVQISYASPAQNFTPGVVQQAADIIIPSDLKITNTVTTESPSLTLAVNNASSQAHTDAQETQETLNAVQRNIQDLSDAMMKLDSTLRRTGVAR